MGTILLAMTILGLLAAAALTVVAYLGKFTWLKTFVLGGTTVWLAGYVILLAVGSIFSVERELPFGTAKEFCGFYLDCHLHTAVSGVRTAKTLGSRTADGEFYIVTVKVSSDAKAAKLGLLNVEAKAIDADGGVYGRDLAAEAELSPQPDFEKKISPAETFEKQIVFDLPAAARSPRLDIREGYTIDHAIETVLIGDEDSILHKRTYFDLSGQTPVAGIR
jgi:hypothetical protein